jgi:hypothetical protein
MKIKLKNLKALFFNILKIITAKRMTDTNQKKIINYNDKNIYIFT